MGKHFHIGLRSGPWGAEPLLLTTSLIITAEFCNHFEIRNQTILTNSIKSLIYLMLDTYYMHVVVFFLLFNPFFPGQLLERAEASNIQLPKLEI